MRPFGFYSVVIFLLMLFLLEGNNIHAQRDTIVTDTLKIKDSELPKHSPTKAALFSTFVPGLGQAYNKKYWKIPVIYAGLAIPIYFGVDQHNQFVEKRDAYVARVNGDSTDKFLEQGNFFSNEGLLSSMDINRRNRDLMIIIASAVYVLQIVDASVDAHLFYFNVSDDLSFRATPMFYYSDRIRRPVHGLSFTLNF